MLIGLISAYGGRSVLALKKEAISRGFHADVLTLKSLEYKQADKKSLLLLSNNELRNYDVLIVRSVGKFKYELGLVLEYAKNYQIPLIDKGLYFVNPASISKLYMAERLRSYKIPIPSFVYCNSHANLSLDFPIVCKPVNGQRGRGVKLIENENDLEKYKQKYDAFISQKYIPSQGDYRVMVVGEKVLGSMWRKPPANSNFKALIKNGGKRQKVDLPESAIKLAVRSAKACGWQIAGVDLIMNTQTSEWFVLEVNRVPSFQSFENSTNIKVSSAIIDYAVKLAKTSSK